MNAMNIGKIESALQDIFNEPLKDGEQRKIVFWMDEDEEFLDDITRLKLDDVKVEALSDRNQFYIKYLLEEEDSTSSYLIYTNLESNEEDNWLIDTLLYSKQFYADRVSLILNELNIDTAFQEVIKKHKKFFDNKERSRKFKAFGIESYTKETIELAIMSALCNLKRPDFESVLKTVLIDTLDDHDNKYLSLMERFFDIDVFWAYVANYYGYERETRTLKTLMIHLMVTAFSHLVSEVYLSDLQDFIATRNKANALVFIDHWMHHKMDFGIFDEYAEMIEQEIQLSSLLKTVPIDAFKQADTFPHVDRAIIIYIANSLMEQLEDYEEYLKLIKLRRVKHYYEKYEYIYEALYYTVKMHQFYKEHRQRIPQGQAIDLYQAYCKEYHIMDTYYRKFYLAFDKESNHELLNKLKSLVENLYTNWFMGDLSSHWSQAVKLSMTEEWSLPGVQNQQDFYSSIISHHIRKDERVFVIISDAMRYEVGVELAKRLNSETIGVCDIQSMLGVVPSVTKLGMASLLPHRSLDFDGNGRVFVDDRDSTGLENRKKILASFVEESIGIHFQDVLAMNKAGRRETFKGKKLIYIYHDTIDAMGDKASTEVYTFNAVETALNQLYDLVKVIRDDLSGTNVYITADHGFLYQRDSLEESDKIVNGVVDPIEVKRRYALSKEKQNISGQLAINLSSIVKNDQRLTAHVPNGTIRNRMQGSGVNFIHGGASLQEIVVPLLSFKNKRAGQKGAQTITKVDIKLTSTTRRITNSIFHLDFFQTEKVADKVVPRTVEVYMVDSEGTILSNEETIIGDRSFDNPADRTFKIQFVLKNIPYDRNQTYYLVLKDMETGVVTDKLPFTINLGIVSDFDF